MAYIEYNPNPEGKKTDDCVIRAITKATGSDWERVYAELSVQGLKFHDLFEKNYVWMSYLRGKGYHRFTIPNTCPDCYTFADFARDNPVGVFVLGTGTHVATVKDGNIYDSWNSENEIPQFVWYRKEN